MSVAPAATSLDQPLRSGLAEPAARSGVARLLRRPLLVTALALLALAPVIFVFLRTADARHDIVYWDEFDTALALVLKLQEGTTATGFLELLFSVNNEHRMVTSRLMFAATYWLTGTLNFTVLDWIGNGTIIAACLLLIATAGANLRPLKLALLLTLLLFQLEHYENFLWSGSSIDHFQIILLAAIAAVALKSGSRRGFVVAALATVLATLTLAHGIALWLAGAALLWQAGRRRQLAWWGGLAAVSVGLFFLGFEFNRAQAYSGFSLGSGVKIIRYWFSILGAVPGLGFTSVAPVCGTVLLGLHAYLFARGAFRREPVAFTLSLFALIAAGMIAVGRAEHSGGVIFSRYYVLSAVSWALALFMMIERHTHPRRPLQGLAIVLPVLVVFNLFANREFSDETDSWVTCRDMAVVSFQQHGVDGRGTFKLHPNPDRSTALLKQAEAAGLYHLGAICRQVEFPPQTSAVGHISYYVEEVAINRSIATVRGWAGIPGRPSRRSAIHVVLKSATATHLFTAVTVPRADVPAAMKQPGWLNAGFHFSLPIARLPAGDYRIGLLIQDGDRGEFIMTDHRLHCDPGITARTPPTD